MTEQERLNNFILELGKLTKKYKIIIGGRGCCDSPFLVDVHSEEITVIDKCIELSFDDDKQQYEYKKRK